MDFLCRIYKDECTVRHRSGGGSPAPGILPDPAVSFVPASGDLYRASVPDTDPGQGDFRRERADCVFCNALPDTADRIVCHYIGLWSLQKSEN